MPYFNNVNISDCKHFAVLIVDLDCFINDKFVPYVYVYESSHCYCKRHRLFFSYKLNKEYLFQFGKSIIVDDFVLNDDICTFSCNSCSKTQFITLCCFCCGYNCEAVIQTLLTNETFINNGIDPNTHQIIQPGNETRLFLKRILSNRIVTKKYCSLKQRV